MLPTPRPAVAAPARQRTRRRAPRALRGRQTHARSAPTSPPLSARAARSPARRHPKLSRKKPRRSGGKNPPRPPMAPTSPVTVAMLCGKYSGTSLKTAPLPESEQRRAPERPDGEGHHRRPHQQQRKGHDARNTPDRTRAPPMWSDSAPPTGRINVARTTNPAVRSPASAMARPNWSRSSVGR